MKDSSDIEGEEATKNTGRKRAQMLYPIGKEEVCEWAGLLSAGGGIEPIVGCDWNLMEGSGKNPLGGDVHHGPDKNTLNNSPGTMGGNAHRICKSCHHTWHALNDKHYNKTRPPAGEPWLPTEAELSSPHDPFTEASPEQIAAAGVGRKAANRRASDEQIEAVRVERRKVRAQLAGSPTVVVNPFAPVDSETPVS